LIRSGGTAAARVELDAYQAAFAKVSTATATRAVSGAITCPVSLTDASVSFFDSETALGDRGLGVRALKADCFLN
jgi:hypothetical protein